MSDDGEYSENFLWCVAILTIVSLAVINVVTVCVLWDKE